jgi:PKD repeat protein
MEATLNTFRWNIWQYANVWATGCDSSYVSPSCNAVADFNAAAQNVCIGNPILFTNKSLNGCTAFQWYFPGGTPSTSTALNPTVTYNNIGNYNVSLVATNAVGTDSIAFSNYIAVSAPPLGQSLPFVEGFEMSGFPPNGIAIDNPDNGITWERDTTAVAFSGIGSAKIDNLININYGQSDAMVFPNFDLTTLAGTPSMTFRWAYAKSDPNYSDELSVLISTDCGVNFTRIFYRTGTAMTTGPTQTTPYIPDSNTVWKVATINLSNYIASTNAIIKIVNVTDGGNNLYIDNINIGAIPTGIEDNELFGFNVSIFPNPAIDIVNVDTKSNSDLSLTEIRIHDMLGNVIYATTQTTRVMSINSSNWSSGIYVVSIQQGSSCVHKKLILNKNE